MDYFDFEGVHGAGYGAGDVIVWDWGTWTLRKATDCLVAVASGDLHFELHGEKLAGRFALVRRGRSPNQWLLIHGRDEHAVPGWDPEDHPARSRPVAPTSRWRPLAPLGAEGLGARLLHLLGFTLLFERLADLLGVVLLWTLLGHGRLLCSSTTVGPRPRQGRRPLRWRPATAVPHRHGTVLAAIALAERVQAATHLSRPPRSPRGIRRGRRIPRQHAGGRPQHLRRPATHRSLRGGGSHRLCAGADRCRPPRRDEVGGSERAALPRLLG